MESISTAGKFGHLERLRERTHLYATTWKLSSSENNHQQQLCVYHPAKCFVSVTLLDPLITPSGTVSPILQIKKKNEKKKTQKHKPEAVLGQGTGKKTAPCCVWDSNPCIRVYLNPALGSRYQTTAYVNVVDTGTSHTSQPKYKKTFHFGAKCLIWG